ncbi:MAG: carbohydrate ABC transporter permease, partial [Paenibacillaceae bacterium]|nr:carbohydrate ABC transporter permease [Paenibacillaceae bacterium]
MDDAYEARSIRTDLGGIIVKIVGYLFIGFFSLCCLLPFLLVLGTSFTSESAIKRFGFNFWPREFSTFSYKIVFENPDLMIGSYLVTIGITVCGTALGLFLVAMTGYALQRPDFAYRNRISFFIYFTTLFTGGLVPFYLLVTQYLSLKDNYLAVLLPGLLSPFLIIMMKSFVRSIPHA